MKEILDIKDKLAEAEGKTKGKQDRPPQPAAADRGKRRESKVCT